MAGSVVHAPQLGQFARLNSRVGGAVCIEAFPSSEHAGGLGDSEIRVVHRDEDGAGPDPDRVDVYRRPAFQRALSESPEFIPQELRLTPSPVRGNLAGLWIQ